MIDAMTEMMYTEKDSIVVPVEDNVMVSNVAVSRVRRRLIENNEVFE